jgi:RNA polymerase sigma-70 factor (ECF subfamily)
MPAWEQADLEELYRRLERPLYNVVYRLVWDREQARDLVQESFVRLWDMRRRIEPTTVEPLAYRIAINLARSALRRRRIWRWVPLVATLEPSSRDRGADDTDDECRLRRAIDALAPDLRDVVLLTSFTELRHPEIARILGIAEGTVGSRRHRALRQLRAALTEDRDERRA